MITLYQVKRTQVLGGLDVIATMIVKADAEQFARECRKLEKGGRAITVEETCLSTYGMAEETRRKLFEAVRTALA